MFNEYGMSVAARQHLADLRREAEADRLASACPKRQRRRRVLRTAASVPAGSRRRWRGGLAWFFGY